MSIFKGIPTIPPEGLPGATGINTGPEGYDLREVPGDPLNLNGIDLALLRRRAETSKQQAGQSNEPEPLAPAVAPGQGNVAA